MGAVSTDLSQFRRHGGKIIIYDAVNDGIFSAASLTRWYREMTERTADAPSFSRLYLVPNMAHCGGGPATANFGGNLLQALTNWVEDHQAPDQIIASNTNTASPFPGTAPFDPRVAQNFPTGGTRLLCPYPQTTHYTGTGPTNAASSFVCVRPDVDDDDDRDHDHDHD